MKRAFALEPFSRDHNDGLQLARALKEGRPGSAESARRAWDEELADHFAEEERLLGSLAGEREAQMLEEHRRIADLIDRLPETVQELGDLLEAHIRWEERVLFPAIEATLTPDHARALLVETLLMEQRRWPQCPQRARLVQARLRHLH